MKMAKEQLPFNMERKAKSFHLDTLQLLFELRGVLIRDQA